MPLDRYLTFGAIAAIGLTADLLTKKWAFENHFNMMDSSVSLWWISDILGVQTSFNGGALFGIFQGGSPWLAGLSIIALITLTGWLFLIEKGASRYMTIVLAMITAGILGNLYDRTGFGFRPEHPAETMYHVRDWIHFRLEGVPMFDPWPNFNIADSLLVTGAALICFAALFAPGLVGNALAGGGTGTNRREAVE